jgi:hypothetical protein
MKRESESISFDQDSHEKSDLWVSSDLVTLDTLVWGTVLLQSVVLSWLVVAATRAAGARVVAGSSAGVSSLLASLMWVNLALCELCDMISMWS